MSKEKKTWGYWTFDKCKIEALKYKHRSEFNRGSSGAYSYSLKYGHLDLLCSHMTPGPRHSKWTIEKCKTEALKYKHRGEFRKKASGAYQHCTKNGCLDEVCSHMVCIGNKYYRFVYSVKFQDNSIYIGLTVDFNKRKSEHLANKKSSVFKYMILTDQDPIFSLITPKPIPSVDAQNMECDLIEHYLCEKNYNVLNRMNGGGLGGKQFKWTKERCHEEAMKYTSRGDFYKYSPGASQRARKNGWMDEICSHMPELVKSKGYWTKERCHEEAIKYTSRSDYYKYSFGASQSARINGWMDEICSHMPEIIKPNGYWNKERCHEEALKYDSKVQFAKNYSSAAYNVVLKNGWMQELCSHMPELVKPKGYWTKERCHEEALKHDTRNEFSIAFKGAWSSARINGWLDEICSHMPEIVKPNGYWTKERCHEEALKHTDNESFRKASPSAYNVAYLNGWLEEIRSHMFIQPGDRGYWTMEKCMEELSKYTVYAIFKSESPAYKIISKRGWISKLCSHMK